MTPLLNRRHLLKASAIALLAPNLPAFGTPIPQLDFPIEDVCHAAVEIANREMLVPIEGVPEFHRYFDPRPARDGDFFDMEGEKLELQHVYTSFTLLAPTPSFRDIIDNYVSPLITAGIKPLRRPGTLALCCRPLVQDDPRHGVRQHEEFNDGISLTITTAYDYIREQHLFTIEGLFATNPPFEMT